MGRARLFTTFDAAAGGAIVNQVERVFNGFGWITAEYQEHAGAVVRATSPKVQYDYAMANGGGRLLKMTYPTESRFLVYQYGAGINDNISRISAIADSAVGGGVVESYHYLGLGTIVQRNQPQVGEKLTFIRQAGDDAAAGNDRYSGLDRFGRIIDQNWVRTAASAGGAAGTSSVRLQYQYDRAGNAIARHDLVDAALSELYEYDPLDRLVSFQRGVLSASTPGGPLDRITSPTLQQSWDLDALGNWSGTATGGATTNREFNVGNQTTSVSGGTAPTYDAVGNTTSKDGHEYAYDAWGRLASVKAAGGSVLANYTYDALGRRAVEIHPGLRVNDVYFTPGWEAIEDRTNTTTHLTVIGATGQIVFRDVYALGALGEDWRYYPRQNANGDVVALVKGAAPVAGYVLERHAYEPYGSMLVMAGDGTPRPGGTSYSWRVFFQGGRLDNVSGLYNFQFRDYDPHSGTWTTRDPIGLGGGDPNLYRFVGNNPVNRTDPSGLIWPAIIVGALAGANYWIWRNNAVVADDLLNYRPINPANTPYNSRYYKGLAGHTAAGGGLGLGVGLAVPILPAWAAEAGGMGLSGLGAYSSARSSIRSFSEGNYAQGTFDTTMTGLAGYGGYINGRSLFPKAFPASGNGKICLRQGEVSPWHPRFPSQETFRDSVFDRYQQFYDQADAIAQARVAAGRWPNDPMVVGGRMDAIARARLRSWLRSEGIAEGPCGVIQVNRWLRDPAGSGAYRIPDIRIPGANTILDGTIGAKTSATPQVVDFRAFSGGDNIIIVRPTRIGGSYGVLP